MQKLIIGLGNPGEKYKNNRHNAGYIVVGELKKLRTKEIKNFKITKTDCFMNSSGSFVKKILDSNKLSSSNLFIIHDDLDIPLGSYKIQFGKGPKNHNGLNDIYEKLGTKDFWHIRIGIENRDRDRDLRVSGEDYVLQDFTDEERKTLDITIRKLLIDLIALISKN